MKKFKYYILIILFSIITINIYASSYSEYKENINFPNFTKIVKNSSSSVVNISTIKKSLYSINILPEKKIPEIFKKFFGNRNIGYLSNINEVYSIGTGFIISNDGYILTNAHVVNNSDKIIVKLKNNKTDNKTDYIARLIGIDNKTDIALIKIKVQYLPVINLGNSDEIQVGEWVAAIGSPFGFDQTITSGIVSAINRTLPNDIYVPFIQTDVAINPGNSGGPLLNIQGKVIGINSQIITRSGGFMGLSFSIPINIAMKIANQIKIYGQVHRGWLGIKIKPLFDNENFKNNICGILIYKILFNNESIKPGDIIISVNGKKIKSYKILTQIVNNIIPGQKIMLKILRNGKYKNIKIKVCEVTN
ncbi:Serine protease MucD [Candidatus Portiera aleyrodidarum]|uniref:S1C family serine protease n=1 Tax=Candidatus Portiera aleyrodidarum TaxID=91844 RepID=UPI0005D99241|nr:trypsin-like peptidase domain-containing protein [Candidatus Portiera aleyrodidarum]CEL12301.1 Serine protease MucD [Candidatus Portiera aleyrodidarum]